MIWGCQGPRRNTSLIHNHNEAEDYTPKRPFPDFPAARNAIPAKVWALSGKEDGCWKIDPAFGNAPGYSYVVPILAKDMPDFVDLALSLEDLHLSNSLLHLMKSQPPGSQVDGQVRRRYSVPSQRRAEL